jgi:hypothetical protein
LASAPESEFAHVPTEDEIQFDPLTAELESSAESIESMSG